MVVVFDDPIVTHSLVGEVLNLLCFVMTIFFCSRLCTLFFFFFVSVRLCVFQFLRHVARAARSDC
jgi:hypothetical protein